MPNLSDILQIVPLVQSHAWVALAIVLIGLVSKLLSGETPGPKLPVRVRVGVVIALSGTTATLEAVQSHRPILDAVISGVVVIFAALAAHDGEALRELLGQASPPASGSGTGGKDPSPAPKAAPPGTLRVVINASGIDEQTTFRSLRSALAVRATRLAGVVAIGFAALLPPAAAPVAVGVGIGVVATDMTGCAAFKQDTKTALNDVQIACIFEHAIGIDSMIPGQDAAILAGICHLDDSLIPLVATVLSEHRRAEAMEIARHAGAPAPCGSAR